MLGKEHYSLTVDRGSRLPVTLLELLGRQGGEVAHTGVILHRNGASPESMMRLKAFEKHKRPLFGNEVCSARMFLHGLGVAARRVKRATRKAGASVKGCRPGPGPSNSINSFLSWAIEPSLGDLRR